MTSLESCVPLKPDTSNICTDETPNPSVKGSGKGFVTRTIPNSCTCFSFKNALKFANGICSSLGDDEWVLAETLKHSPKCPNDGTFANGCGKCPDLIVNLTREIQCSRVAYNGNPAICCLRDYDFGNINQYCFQTDDKSKTCDPGFRNVTNNVCQINVNNFCLGRDLPSESTDWFERWTTASDITRGLPPCIYALNRNLFLNPFTPSVASGDPPGGEFFINPEGFRWAQDLLDAAFLKYNIQGFEIGSSPGFPGYSDFQNTLYTICRTVPGLCETKLPDICADVTNEELTINPALISWCGCYMPDAQYAMYVNDFGITKECTPMCSQINAIKLPTPSRTDVLRCKQNICIMDDITIALAESQVAGNINFVQLCGNCSGKSSCQCVISDVDIEIINSSLGGDVDITQLCGQSTCVRTNPKEDQSSMPRTLPVNCQDPIDNPFEQFEMDQTSSEQFKETIITISIIVIFFLFLITVFVLAVKY